LRKCEAIQEWGVGKEEEGLKEMQHERRSPTLEKFPISSSIGFQFDKKSIVSFVFSFNTIFVFLQMHDMACHVVPFRSRNIKWLRARETTRWDSNYDDDDDYDYYDDFFFFLVSGANW
jgi:hypothetical protein